MTPTDTEKLTLSALKHKPSDIEEALRHCTQQEQCDGCPLANVKGGYCGQILNTEALHYIEILKELNRTFAQELERRDNQTPATTAKADSK